MHSYNYLMNSSYDRINEGKFYNKNFKPYEKDFIKEMISYFENLEEYEKCKILLDFFNKRFNHENNYQLV